jgi:hypothetical protein
MFRFARALARLPLRAPYAARFASRFNVAPVDSVVVKVSTALQDRVIAGQEVRACALVPLVLVRVTDSAWREDGANSLRKAYRVDAPCRAHGRRA